MRDIQVVRNNVAKLSKSGKTPAEVDSYVKMEGYDPSKLYDGEVQQQQQKPADNGTRIPTKDMIGTVAKGMIPGLAMTENLTDGASEDLLPMAGQLIGGAVAGGASKSPIVAMGGAGLGGGAGEVLRQGVRALRGKNTDNIVQDVEKEAALGAVGEGVGLGAAKTVKALATTKMGRATVNAFANAFGKAMTLTQKGQNAVMDVINFMGDLHPKSVQYAVKRGPGVLFRPENYADDIMGKTAKDVVERLDQTRQGASKAFEATLKDFYKAEYLKKYPYIKKVTAPGLEKIKSEIRFYPGRVVDAGEKAMQAYGYKNRLGNLKPTVLANLGSKMDEGERLNAVIDRIRGYKDMTPDDAITLREELNQIIYDGWKEPKTKVHISEASGTAKSVLKSINKELSDRLHTRVKGLKPIDDTYQMVSDLAHQAKPYYGNTDSAEKFMRKYHAMTKGSDRLTTAEKEVIDQVDQIIPHKQKVLDHLYAMEFKPVISNFWKSRAISSLVAGGVGGVGYASGGGPGVVTAAGIALAATSPRLISKGLRAGEKVGKGVGKVAQATGKAVKAGTKVAMRTAPVQSQRVKKNEAEK